MVEKDDWRLLNNVEHLKSKYINPTDGEEISKHAPHLKSCSFCMEQVRNNPRDWWYVPEDMLMIVYPMEMKNRQDIYMKRLLHFGGSNIDDFRKSRQTCHYNRSGQ